VSKEISTLVKDIYSVAGGITPIEVTSEETEQFIQEMLKEVEGHLRKFVSERQTGMTSEPFKLRPSNIGLPPRKLWLDSRSSREEGNKITFSQRPYQPISFMFGNLCESWILFLAKLSGHSVTNQQQTISLGGLQGSKDCDIDGVVVDVKSASPFSFIKVKGGSLNSAAIDDDPWGYRDQLTFYAEGKING